jgi:hypothetical protein
MSGLLMIIDFILEIKNCKLDLVLVSRIGGTLISTLILVFEIGELWF